MDSVGFHEHRAAEKDARAAAVAAHASYYAHPNLHMQTYTDMARGMLYGNETEVQANAPGVPCASDAAGTIHENEGDNPDKDKTSNKVKKDDKNANGVASRRSSKSSDAKPHTDLFLQPGPTAAAVHSAYQQGQNGAAAPQGMNPHLQLMCGPLVSYHTIENGTWHGAALIVTADNGSVLTSAPALSLSFTPYGSHGADGMNGTAGLLPSQTVQSDKIYTYNDQALGPCSFYRFMLAIPVQDVEMTVAYRLNSGAPLEFVIPARGQNLRWAAHSCNGFSSGVDPDKFKGNFASGYDPVWEDLLSRHREAPYHALVGGGDQLYCDPIIREPELQSWINAPSREKKLGHPLTEEMKSAIHRFYFNHYCKMFRSNAFGRANATIPMVNMLDDHDLIDGFGTYDDETMDAPVLKYIGSAGYFWFLLFQLFTVDAFDGANVGPPGSNPIKSLVIGGPGPWVPYPSHSLAVYMGPNVRLYALDCRAERKLHQIVSAESYKLMSDYVESMPPEVEQLVLLLGVPIAYPRMSFVEHFLEKKWNPINILARHNALGLGGMVNKFNQAAELLDDLNDHWCANVHKKERNWLVLEMQRLALAANVRVSFLSGDVHLTAVGCLFTHKHRHKLQPAEDHRYMLNVVSSAIVNTPPPSGAATLVAVLAGNKHRTLHKKQTDETMLPIFKYDTDGKTQQKRPYTLARRNYTSVNFDTEKGLVFDIRVEKYQGAGETASYPVAAPPPRWSPQEPLSPLPHPSRLARGQTPSSTFTGN